jgi:hypothetical protein
MSSTLAIVVYLQARAYEIKDRGGASDKTGMGAFSDGAANRYDDPSALVSLRTSASPRAAAAGSGSSLLPFCVPSSSAAGQLALARASCRPGRHKSRGI